MANMNLLVIGDPHFVGAAQIEEDRENCESDLASELIERTLIDARRRYGFDAVALMGDLVQRGTAPGAPDDLRQIKSILDTLAPDTPQIIVPGNHDEDAELVYGVFADRPGPHHVDGHCLYSFSDRWDEENVGHRPTDQWERFKEFAAANSRPLVVLQHNPLYPPIERPYPYILAEATDLMETYSRTGVTLSLSGHYHPGQTVCKDRGVRYYIAPSLSKSPFRYAVVEMSDGDVEVHERALRLPEYPPLFDVHVHTEYAYCGEDISARAAVRRAEVMSLKGITLSEHADQLYLTEQEHRNGYVYDEPDYWEEGRPGAPERMPAYRNAVTKVAGEAVQLGLEIELDAAWRPGVRPEDCDGWDLLIGAVHWLPGGIADRTEREIHEGFMKNAEILLSAGCTVLAHPFRFFLRNDLPVPRDLYDPLAQLLAREGVAAEINCHTNEPDPEFFAICIEQGVPIALGSDAHRLSEVGDFYPQLEILREAAGGRPLNEVLFSPAT